MVAPAGVAASESVLQRLCVSRQQASPGALCSGLVVSGRIGHAPAVVGGIDLDFGCGARFVAPNWRLLWLGFLRRMRRAGFPVLVWTVNDSRQAQALAAAGVAAIATDRPAELRAVLEPRA